ncbi:MAG: amino acid dehydrogenase [Rhodobacterales bacterium 12-64-8]|nr:MAG: amino acid dehydrogenase [Rhodobacterales bacterium 12-64-8]OYX48954.1 MAG: amino acid dehydrogenase [Alphaproteobacteria bacterium 32-64-14]
MFDKPAFAGHESVHHFFDRKTGLRAIIAIHSTALGPAAGGCRMWNYATSDDAFVDALRLSEGMSYKNAMADLPLGGGKAVIWGNSKTDKTPELFRALGRAIATLNGRYWSAEDVGVSVHDMAHAAGETKYVAGLPSGKAASGDPSPVTARGVFLGIKTAALRAFGTDDLNGRHVAVQGVGHVGAYVCGHLAKAGAKLTITDVNQEALDTVSRETGASVVAPNEIYDVAADIFSPNALGAIINPETLPRLRAKVIAGGANNQLSTPDLGEKVKERGILYAPDYVINGGGIINVAAEISGVYDPAWVDGKVTRLVATLGEVLDQAQREGKATNRVADAIARQRIGR